MPFDIQIQCVLKRNAFNKNAVLGAFEDALAKVGNILYELDPLIPKDTPYGDYKRIWTIGLDVSHTTSRKAHKPSTAMLCLQTLPFKGTQRGMRCVAHLNNARTEVIPFAAAVTMTFNALMMEKKKLMDKNTAPKVIMVFRDGVPDNALKEVHSKELVGILRGIRLVREELKEKHKIKWKVCALCSVERVYRRD